MEYVGSRKIDDWRYREEKDKIITILFKTKFLFGKPEGSDDLEEAKWFAVNALKMMIESGQIAKEHIVLMELLLQNINV
jgi:bifunctional NMN adenylyltransferase/nudix hydrolase